jgi:hypothetical protein
MEGSRKCLFDAGSARASVVAPVSYRLTSISLAEMQPNQLDPLTIAPLARLMPDPTINGISAADQGDDEHGHGDVLKHR